LAQNRWKDLEEKEVDDVRPWPPLMEFSFISLPVVHTVVIIFNNF
jgi:hypothetical protein